MDSCQKTNGYPAPIFNDKYYYRVTWNQRNNLYLLRTKHVTTAATPKSSLICWSHMFSLFHVMSDITHDQSPMSVTDLQPTLTSEVAKWVLKSIEVSKGSCCSLGNKDYYLCGVKIVVIPDVNYNFVYIYIYLIYILVACNFHTILFVMHWQRITHRSKRRHFKNDSFLWGIILN